MQTIRVQRRDTQELLAENPSLKPYLEEALPNIYESGKDLAVEETNLPLKTFLENCSYTLEAIFRDGFYPGKPAADDLME